MQGGLRAQQEMIRSSLDEVRHVARRLRPGMLDDLGLLSAITGSAAAQQQSHTDFRAHTRTAVGV